MVLMIRDGVSVHQERRKEPLILDTQFLKLNDCEAYMLLPENTPVTKIKLIAKSRTVLTKALIPTELLNVSLGDLKSLATISRSVQDAINPDFTKSIVTKKPAAIKELEF